MSWEPHVTVATVAENQGRFLVVKEIINKRAVYNQPAGHWEQNETLIDAAVRETLEETAYEFVPKGVVGIYQWTVPDNPSLTFLRLCLHGEAVNHDAARTLDDGIIEADWLSRKQLADNPDDLRSPMVLSCIDDYLAGKSYPLDMLSSLDNHINR